MFKPALISTILLSSMLVGCGADDDDDDDAGTSYLRVLHASPDAPNVDVLIDGEAVLTDVPFQAGSGYLEVEEGQREVALRVHGTDTIALTNTITFEEDGYYSAIAQNLVASLELEVLDDTERYNNGTTDVTVVHASPTVGNVDIYVTADGADLPASATLSDVPFDANATLEEIASADYQVRATAAGDTTVVYDSGTLSISSDVMTVAVNSAKGASPVTLLAWASSVTPVLDNTAEVRIVHAVDAVTVDVFAGGAELLGDFAYKDTTDGYVKVAAGDLPVAIAAANAGIDSALSNLSGTLTLARGESYTVVAAGDVNDLNNAQLIVLTDVRKATDDTQAYVRLVHASAASAADPVDIYVAVAGGDISAVEPNFSDVVIGQNTGYVALAPASYDVIIAADGTKTAAVPNTSNLTFNAGDVVTALAIGNSAGNLEPVILVDKR